MPNQFLISTKKALDLHGLTLSYTSVTTGAYNIETGSVTNTTTNYSKKIYPKHIRATAYNYPDYIGKDTVMFYLANDSLGFTPKVSDVITYNSKAYKVESLQTHSALGEVVLYRLLAVSS